MPNRPCSLVAAAVGLALAASSGHAANAAFQSFFFAVCPGATGALATRCAQTPAGLGDLSGDSESSLNPSQSLSRNAPNVGVALARTKAVRERGERQRDPDLAGAIKMEHGRLSLLINVLATDTDRASGGLNSAERGFEGDSQAIEAGLDYRLSDKVVIGGLLGAERSKYRFDAEAAGTNFAPQASAGGSDADNKYLTMFGNWAIGQSGFIELSGGYEKYSGSYRRFPVFQESTRQVAQTNVVVEGDADSKVRWASINAGFDVSRKRLSYGPFLGISTVRATLDGFAERDLSGSGLNMRFSSTTRKSLLAHAGMHASYSISGKSGVFVPQLRLEYQKDFADDPETLAASFALDPRNTQLQLQGRTWDRDGINAGFSMVAVLPNGWMPYLDYSTLLGYKSLKRQRLTLGLRVEF